MTRSPDVELRIPADSAFLAVLRTATAGLAARIDFTLDDIEDLRIAVDEACAMLLPQARAATDLRCAYWLGPATITVTITADGKDPEPPRQDGFAWRVLSALTTSLDAVVTGDELTLTLSRSAGRHP